LWRYGLSICDAVIDASALHADCDTLWSEDMQEGRVLDDRLRIVYPSRKVHEYLATWEKLQTALQASDEANGPSRSRLHKRAQDSDGSVSGRSEWSNGRTGFGHSPSLVSSDLRLVAGAGPQPHS
jgi:hypothetical protein